MKTLYRHFHIHGDNIMECEKTLRLIELALADECSSPKGSFTSPTTPSFKFKVRNGEQVLVFMFFPGFGRWAKDIRKLIRDRGGIVREAPDVIVSEVTSGQESPLVAIEYSGALDAGNQAWQRNGRAYSIGLAHIPFLHVTEIGGYELNSKRTRKAIRLPNPAIPFSYLSFSSSMDKPILPVFLLNPGATEEVKTRFVSAIGERELIEFIRAAILTGNTEKEIKVLEEKCLKFIQQLASASHHKQTLTPNQWAEAYQAIKSGDGSALVSYLLRKTALRWSKTAYIKGLTSSAKKLMKIAAELSIGLTSSDLPICLIPPENRSVFALKVERLYPRIPPDFLDWLRHEGPLVICWVMGFKPGGEDARPDRGLPPLIRMLIGSEVEMLTVVYGPAPQKHWSMLIEDLDDLIQQNGLWEAIMMTSNAILVDSTTDNITSHGLLHQTGNMVLALPNLIQYPILVPSIPQDIKEHDIDTVIHTLFVHLGSAQVFEGLCNPPGGDWSGISLLTKDKSKELRWLSLPRVSGPEAKRPDHVLQIFHIRETPIIFSIESKETAKSVEEDIGTKLKAYITSLLLSSASIERENNKGATWQWSNTTLQPSDFLLASGVGFLVEHVANLTSVRKREGIDLQIGLQFDRNKIRCKIHLFPNTKIGKVIAGFIKDLPLDNTGFSIHVHQ